MIGSATEKGLDVLRTYSTLPDVLVVDMNAGYFYGAKLMPFMNESLSYQRGLYMQLILFYDPNLLNVIPFAIS